MAVLAIDLGGTKVALATFSEKGELANKLATPLDKRRGQEVSELIRLKSMELFTSQKNKDPITSIGISVPGISYTKTGTVWAPNIPGWDNYPLFNDVKEFAPGVHVTIDSDRACYILGELWKGKAQGCHDAIYLSVGTGIGAGILVNDMILRGSHDIGGAIGWMALDRPFTEKYISCGCFEYHASGEGIAKVARDLLKKESQYEGELKDIPPERITAQHVFSAYDKKDIVANKVIHQCIGFWGMAAANLVSLFNPEKIIFGGGVFGPAIKFLPQIKSEASRWAQPISITQVAFETSDLGNDAGIYGAGYLALKAGKHER
jgi:glucokinase